MALTSEQLLEQYNALSDEGAEYEPAGSVAESNLDASSQFDPDEYARKRDLSKKTGVPVEALTPENEKEIARSDETSRLLQQYRSLGEGAPITAKFAENPVNAIVSQDDLETLAAIERESNRSWYEVDERTFENWGDTALMGMGKTWDQLSIHFFEGLKVKGIDVDSLVTGGGNPLSRGLGMVQEEILSSLYGPDKIDMWNEQLEKKIAPHVQNLEFAESEIARLTPQGLSVMEEGLRGGVQMVADMAPGLAISIATRGKFNPTLGLLTGKTYLDSYGSAITSGKDHETAKAYAGIDAVIEYWSERIPTKRLEALLGEVGGKGIKSSIKRWLVGEALGEQGATLGQSLNAYAFELDDELAGAKDVWEALEIQGRRQAVTFISTLAGGGSMAGTIKGVDYLANRERRAMAKVIERTQKFRGSEAEQKRIDNLVYLAQSSKTNERAADMFAEFMDEAAPEQKIYVDPAVMGEWAFSDLGKVPDTLLRQIDQSGGMIEMTMSQFMTEFASDEARMEVLRPFIKTNEELYTPTEMESDDAKDFIKELLSTAAAAKETKSQADTIAETLIEQLVATGRQSEATARQSIAITTAQVVTQYELLKKSGFKKEDGSEVTLEELYADFNLRIAKPDEVVARKETDDYMTQDPNSPEAQMAGRKRKFDALSPEKQARYTGIAQQKKELVSQWMELRTTMHEAGEANPDQEKQEHQANMLRSLIDDLNGEIEDLVGSGPDLSVVPPRVLKQQNFGNIELVGAAVDEAGNAVRVTESAATLWKEQQQRQRNIEKLRGCLRG
jgi:hypothetical protein